MNIKQFFKCLRCFLILLLLVVFQEASGNNKRVYRINKTIDLNGDTLVLNPNSKLLFRRNGKIINGCIFGNNSTIVSNLQRVRFGEDVVFAGSFNCDLEYDWLYESDCYIKDTAVVIFNRQYNVKVANGINQWYNFQNVFKRLNGAFKGLHFNKRYVLDNPNKKYVTSSNLIQIFDRVENLVISGGVFYNAGLAFYNWSNIEIKDLCIIGRYHDFKDRSLDVNWSEFHDENGEALCYNSVGLHLTSPYNSTQVNSNAKIYNVSVESCYNGIYIGRWSGTDPELRTVKDVTVSSCHVRNVIYHGYASCNCDRVKFDRNYGENSYLGTLIDISRGSSNVVFSNGIGKNYPQPFKIANNNNHSPTVDCCIDSCSVSVSSILRDCTFGPSITLFGLGNCSIDNNDITYLDSNGVTLLSIACIEGESKYSFSNNLIRNNPCSCLVRYTISGHPQSSSSTINFYNNNIQSYYSGATLYGVIVDDMRTKYANVSAIISFKNNRISSNCEETIPKLRILRRQGSSDYPLMGKVLFDNNLISHPIIDINVGDTLGSNSYVLPL